MDKADLEVLSDFPYKSLEWKFSNKEFGCSLVSPDLSKDNSAGTEPATPPDSFIDGL
jgi:hypothetical protein